MSLYVNNKKIVYEIKSDFREKDISKVKEYISEQVMNAFNDNQILYISEYFARAYMTISDGEHSRQFIVNKK